MKCHDADASLARLQRSRRRFVQGLALGGAAAGFGLARMPGFAMESADANAPRRTVLTGTDFDLAVGELAVNFTGAMRHATVVNGQLPAPLLRWRRGRHVTLRVRNTLPSTDLDPLARHRAAGGHGRRARPQFHGHRPGETYVYRFTVNQAGTYWYHSHSRFQEQVGLYGPIVIEPRDGERFPTDREHVVLLSDWTDADPERIYATSEEAEQLLQLRQADRRRFLARCRRARPRQGARRATHVERMRMDPSDLADVSATAYTYLMNGAPPARNWTALFSRGEKVRLRFINGASMTFFDVRIPGLDLDRRRGRRAGHRAGNGRRIPHRSCGNLRRDRRACRRSRLHDLRAVDGPLRLRARHARATSGHGRRRFRRSIRVRC